MHIHIVHPFRDALAGSERSALELYQGLKAHGAQVSLWCEGGTPDARITELPIRTIDQRAGAVPADGTLVITGNWFALGTWIENAHPDRLVLLYNTVVRPDLKYGVIDRLRTIGSLEIIYETRAVADWVAIPGTVFASLIDLDEFVPGQPRTRHAPMTVGRLSRDIPAKHHPDDPALYQRLARQGFRIRVMGGLCLTEAVESAPAVELLPQGALTAAAYLQGLDIFYYRTAPSYSEAGGRVVCEAMACGLPVVCHVNGGYAEWIEHGVDGFLFSTEGEAEDLLVRLRDDAALRTRIGAAARAKMEQLFSRDARAAYFDFFLREPPKREHPPARTRVDLAWELGGHTGHVTTLLPIARTLQARGHPVRFMLKELKAGADLDGMATIERVAAPIWVGPFRFPNPRNFGEILTNFGYSDPVLLRQLIESWRDRLAQTGAIIANVAPAAHIAALTLGIPSFEISQGFHSPPPTMPAPPLRHWEPAPRAELEATDRAVLAAINRVLAAYGVAALTTIGELFVGRTMLLTYPELDIYPERGPAEYFGIPYSGEGSAVPDWPKGRGRRAFGYLYQYYAGLPRLLEALERLDMPTLLLCRGVDPALKQRFSAGSVRILEEPMAVSTLVPQCDLVICHGSHQMSAQSLLAGRPMLMLPSQLEQFLITRRVVRYGAALGVVAEQPDADYAAALEALTREPKYAEKAQAFARRYAAHDRNAALETMVRRCEEALMQQGAAGAAHG